jgi:aminopeptidase
MLTAAQLSKYADVLLWGLTTARKGRFRKGDIVLIQYDPPAVRLVEILQGLLLDQGLNPVLRIAPTFVMERNYYDKSDDRQLVFLVPGDKELYESLNGRIYLRAPESLTHLSKVDSARIGRALVARKMYREIMNKREDQGVYGWTLCTLPTAELAKQARTSLKSYTDQIIRACYLDKKNPVSEWKRIYKEVGTIKKWLNSLKIKHLQVESRSMDLTITPGEKRKWLGVSGHNIPSFEIFLSPDWRGTEGTYYADQPSFRSGNYVEKVKLVFKKGSVVKASAATGRTFIEKQLAMDRGASRVGEFSLTDRRFSRIDRFMADTLFDENFGGKYGNCHLAVGSSYSDTYAGDPAELTEDLKKKLGFNDSALHWDLVNTEDKTVTAVLVTGERKIIYESGVFKY